MPHDKSIVVALLFSWAILLALELPPDFFAADKRADQGKLELKLPLTGVWCTELAAELGLVADPDAAIDVLRPLVFPNADLRVGTFQVGVFLSG